ncbi:AcrR family transcriptional regulator [Kibdelosporangium banguiense]|uniref:AcrR family transcriptional regulator n=1 Tax=Kibdelosporangium banguiense TaxID=1365924 RepID=A0ABS4TL32_9PSEU|nr:TetR/AcrR family transcriptional regulator [Kibdelosporangium banguiense]MBP2325132.1 AcrR family transcriptional regulator [Kibdelosporangium banguiense]
MALSREQIVAAAIEVADEGGLDAVTMRLVGQRLGATGMALYRHIANREALIEAMIDAVIGEFCYPEPRPSHWRDALAALARQDWRSYLAHPWMLAATATSRPPMGPNMLNSMEWALACFDGFDLTVRERLYLFSVVIAHGQGLALTWTQDRRPGATKWWQEQLAGVDMPRLQAIPAEFGDEELDFGEEFEFGLQRVLDGLQSYLDNR